VCEYKKKPFGCQELFHRFEFRYHRTGHSFFIGLLGVDGQWISIIVTSVVLLLAGKAIPKTFFFFGKSAPTFLPILPRVPFRLCVPIFRTVASRWFVTTAITATSPRVKGNKKARTTSSPA
jgi:hypothetical protein